MYPIFDMVITTVCLVNRYYTYQIKPFIKEIDIVPMYVDHDI